MDKYGEIAETYLKENQRRFYEAFNITIPIDKYI